MTDALEPWDRRADETDPAWEAFIVYRDLGLQRSQNKAAELLAKSRQMLSQWSIRHDWSDRAAAWDLEQDRQRREAMRVENIAAGQRHARQAARHLEVGEAFAAELLRRLEVGELELKSLPRDELVDAVVKLGRVLPRLVIAERLARGMSTENVELAGSIELARERADRMTNDELEALIFGRPEPLEDGPDG